MTKYLDSKLNQDNKTLSEVYYVTAEQYDIISSLKSEAYPSLALAMNTFAYGSDYEERFSPDALFTDEFIDSGAEALTRFLAGDKTIEYRLKEKLYRLSRIDDDSDKVYMTFYLGTPTYMPNENSAFTAPLEVIREWQTPAWSVEEVG